MKSAGFRRSLILAGGGMRLAYHAGVLQALEEAGISFQHTDGTSGGIFAAAMLASGLSPATIAEKWRKLMLSGFLAPLPFKTYLRPFRLPAFASAEGIRRKIFPALGIDLQKINTFQTADVTFNVCNFSRKTVVSVPHQEVTADHLVAGMSLPLFMPAIRIGGDWFTDAVWIKDANLLEAMNRGAEEIWLIWCIGNLPEYASGSFLQYVQMIEMSANGGLFAEIEELRKRNAERRQRGQQEILLHIIKPGYALPLDPDFFFHKIDADTLINMGYADTRDYLKQPKPFTDELPVAESTVMKSPGNTVHFRQQFSGSTAPGKMHIQLAYFIREAEEGQIILQQYASVSLNRQPYASGYNHTLRTAGGGKICGSFEFLHSGKTYVLKYETSVPSVNDLLLGLAFKTASVSLSGTGINTPPALFSQNAVQRLRNAFFLSIHSSAGWWKKQRLKQQLLTALIN